MSCVTSSTVDSFLSPTNFRKSSRLYSPTMKGSPNPLAILSTSRFVASVFMVVATLFMMAMSLPPTINV